MHVEADNVKKQLHTKRRLLTLVLTVFGNFGTFQENMLSQSKATIDAYVKVYGLPA